MNQILKELLRESQRLLDFFNEYGYEYNCTQHLRNQYAIAHFYIVLDWHIAIVFLAKKEIHGPALTLIRPMLEMSTRGAWLALAATDDEIGRLTSDNTLWGRKRFRDFPRLISEIKSHHQRVGEFFEWNWTPRQFLHDCVHGNNRYINFYFNTSSRTIEPNVPDEPMIAAMNMANDLALMSAVLMASCAQDNSRADLIANRQLQYIAYAKTLYERIESLHGGEDRPPT